MLTACRQLMKLREEGKLPKGGLEAGKIHGLTKEDLRGEPLKFFRPSDDDMKRLAYVPCMPVSTFGANNHNDPTEPCTHWPEASRPYGLVLCVT